MAAGKQPKLLDTGSRAPGFRLQLLDGAATALPEILARGPTVLAFFKVTCPVCQLTLPFLERIHAQGTLPVFGISQNDAEDTRDFNRRFGITFPTLLDPEESRFLASNAFGISSVPTVFLVGRDGSVARVIEGWSKKEIAALGELAGARVFRPGDNVPEFKPG